MTKVLLLKLRIMVLSLCVFFLPVLSGASDAGASDSAEALIILSTNTIGEMQVARSAIEKEGARVTNIFPPSVFIGIIPSGLKTRIKELGGIREAALEQVSPSDYSDCEASVLDAIGVWNSRLEPAPRAKKAVAPELIPKEPFRDTVIIPQDLPKTKEEKVRKDREYQERWKKKKAILQRQEEEKRAARVKGVAMKAVAGQSASGSGQPRFGKAYGAGYYDAGLYMAGDIAVGVFFPPGKDGNWSREAMDTAFTKICNSLNTFIKDEPNAHIAFTFVKEIDENGVPKVSPEIGWDYINDLRNIYDTHWAIKININNENGRATVMRPDIELFSDELEDSNIVRHEVMHVFGATEQYAFSVVEGDGPIEMAGYLGVVNANSVFNDGKGYFGGRGEGISDLMNDRGPIGVYSRGQIGWRDADGDGILDPLDTFPDTTILNKTTTNPIIYSGNAVDKPLFNTVYSNINGSVTINTITKIEYRINSGAWCLAQAKDSAFDSGEEEFEFTLPALKNGKYIIEVRATNSVGNTEVSYAKDEITVVGSSTTNVQPFAAFSITPEEGSIETNFMMDASSSSDIEDNLSSLQVRWDFENDGIWDTAFSTTKTTSFRYSSPGEKNIRLEVKDTHGLTHAIAKTIKVAGYNAAPRAFFTATPESQHGDARDAFTVTLDAAGSRDGEDPQRDLRVRWDFDNDGIWDTDYSKDLKTEHTYSLPQSIPVLARIHIRPGPVEKVCIVGNYAYIASGFAGLNIVDISNPENPKVAGTYHTDGYTIDVAVSGNYAYVVDRGIMFGSHGIPSRLLVINITNPHSPVLIAGLLYDNIEGICIVGNYAYIIGSGVEIIDISNPHKLVSVGRCDIPGIAIDIVASGNYAYVTTFPRSLHVVDVSNVRSPVIVGSCQVPGQGEFKKLSVRDNYVYVANSGQGLQIIDITNPRVPALVGNCATPGSALDVDVSGNYAYVADGNLQIIDITNPRVPVLLSRGLNVSTNPPIQGVCISGTYAYAGKDIFQILDVSDPFKLKPASISKHWRVRLEVMDCAHNTSQAGRDVWVVSYNHPPTIENIELIKKSAPSLELISRSTIGAYVNDIFIAGNYAYLADGVAGLQVIDISDPRAPVLAGKYTSIFPVSVCVAGNYAYAFTLGKLSIIDVSNPNAPVLAGSLSELDFNYICTARVFGNYAYVADGYHGLKIIDISNPKAPVLAGSYVGTRFVGDVYIAGKYAYIAGGSSGLQVFDISDPKIPALAGSCELPNFVEGLEAVGNYLYAIGSDSLQIIDIRDPKSPFLIGSLGNLNGAAEICVSGNYAYIGSRGSGFKIVDITNLRAPVLVGSYNVPEFKQMRILGSYMFITARYADLNIMHIQEQLIPLTVASAVGGGDSDLNASWDGLLKYRWDFDNDGVWDTRFSESSEVVVPKDFLRSTIACQVRDRFGATKTVVVSGPDTTPPEGTIKINNDAVYAGSTSVTLNLSAVDSGSGMGEGSQMGFSNDAVKWSVPEGYATEKKDWVVVPGDGQKTVYVQFKDVAGNWSKPVSDSIKLDTQPPLITNLGISKAGSQYWVKFKIDKQSRLTVGIHNRYGRVLLRELAKDKLMKSGINYLVWDGRDLKGKILSEGYYVLKVSATAVSSGRPSSVTRAINHRP